MSIESIAEGASTFAVPLTMQFRAAENRRGVVFQGPSGWGEFAPFDNYDDEIAGRWLAGALEMAFGSFPATLRDEVPVNAIIPETDEITAYEIVTKAAKQQGISTIKVKVAQPGQNLVDDVARVRAVRSALTDAGKTNGFIRIDANAGWTANDAMKNISILDEVANGLEYVEQPCASLEDVAKVRENVDVKIAIDEGIRLADDLDILAIQDAADIIIVKAIPLGGVQRALRLIDRIGLPVVVSGSMDTSVGLSSALFLAGSVPFLYGACGVGTGSLLALDLVAQTPKPVDGALRVERILPDADCLAIAHALTTQSDREYWRERMVRAWYASAQQLVSPEVKQAVLSW